MSLPKVKAFERKYFSDLEAAINEFAKDHRILQIATTCCEMDGIGGAAIVLYVDVEHEDNNVVEVKREYDPMQYVR